jgi:polyhydroxybutyrate depolymerase
LPDIDPADGTRVDITTFSGCSGGASVVEYAVDGGGHTLPGGDQYAPAFLIGRVSRDINGAQTIWNFLSDFTKP